MSLLEQVKDLRESKRQLEKVTIQNIEWDLDPRFIGEPMIPRVLKALSRYVDTRLMDYSAILGSVPATNMPTGEDDHVCSDVIPTTPTVSVNAGAIIQQMTDRASTIHSVIENMTEPPPDGGVRGVYIDNPQSFDVSARDEPGPLIDDPELYDSYENNSWRIHRQGNRQHRMIQDHHTEADMIADNDNGRPGSEVLLNFCGNDPSPISVSVTSPPLSIPETSYTSELRGDNEHDTVIAGGSINSMTRAFPDVHAWLTWLKEQQEIQEMRQTTENGLQSMVRGAVTGIDPGMTLDVPYGHTGDFQVQSGGCTPHARQRYRDSFVRDRHVVFQIIPELPSSEGREISYVTGYTVEHSTMKIKARVITAPNKFKLLDNLWYDLGDNEGHSAYDLKGMIQNTIKANLCIHMKSRAEPLPLGIQESEQTALETLREMVSEQEFRNYLRYGFLLVNGKSGRVYQIFRHKQHTKVWDRGVLVEEVCVRINWRDIPPTDNVIAFKVMVETSEELFRSRGNVYKMKAA
jgi:hypothetical protein